MTCSCSSKVSRSLWVHNTAGDPVGFRAAPSVRMFRLGIPAASASVATPKTETTNQVMIDSTSYLLM